MGRVQTHDLSIVDILVIELPPLPFILWQLFISTDLFIISLLFYLSKNSFLYILYQVNIKPDNCKNINIYICR